MSTRNAFRLILLLAVIIFQAEYIQQSLAQSEPKSTIRFGGFGESDQISDKDSLDKYNNIMAITSAEELPLVLGVPFSPTVSVAFSPDGSILALGSRGGIIKLWDISNNTEIRTLEGNGNVAFSPDGSILASGPYDDCVKLWDVSSGKEIQTIKGGIYNIADFAFSPDGRTLVTSGGDILTIWDVESGKEIWSLNSHLDHGNFVGFSPDGSTLALGNEYDGTVKLLEVENGTEIMTLEGEGRSIEGLAFSPNGSTLALAYDYGRMKLWDVASGTEIRTWEDNKLSAWGERNVLAFSPDGSTLAWKSGDSYGTVTLWEVASGVEIWTKEGFQYDCNVAFSPDGRILAVGMYDVIAKLLDVSSGTVIQTLGTPPQHHEVQLIAFSPDDRIIASVTRGDEVTLWDVSSGTKIRTLSQNLPVVDSITFSPNGQILAAGSSGTVVLWNVSSGYWIQTLGEPLDVGGEITFDQCGQILTLVCRDGTVKHWDVSSGEEIQNYSDLTNYISFDVEFGEPYITEIQGRVTTARSLDFPDIITLSPDGRTLASLEDGIVTLWDITSGMENNSLQTSSHINNIVFSPDGRTLASGAAGSRSGTLTLWDVASGVEIWTWESNTPARYAYYLNSLAFSPNGQILAAASSLGTVTLWDVANSAELMTLEGHSDRVNCVVFSHDGRTLASGSDDGTIRLWGV